MGIEINRTEPTFNAVELIVPHRDLSANHTARVSMNQPCVNKLYKVYLGVFVAVRMGVVVSLIIRPMYELDSPAVFPCTSLL